jgi:hypothetical protein
MNTVKINTFRDGSRALTFDVVRLFALNEELLKEEGHTLFDLAANDPGEAYGFLRKAIGSIASSSAQDISEDGILLADYKKNGRETACEIAEATLLKHMPAPYEGPFDVEIRLFTTTEEKAMCLGEFSLIMNLHVQPPSLA